MKTILSRMTQGLLLLVLALSFSLISGCSGKKKSPMWWLLLGAGGGVEAEAGNPLDANGEPLPDNAGSLGVQEVATSGPAEINGTIQAVIGDSPAGDVCGMDGAPASPFCLDYTKIKVSLVAPDGTVISSAFLNPDGSFSFSVDDLANNNYRVLIEDGLGLNYTFKDFLFTHDPTSSGGITVVALGTIQAERAYYTSGPALISGTVRTPGFQGGGDDVTVSSGPLSGVTVSLLNPANANEVIATTTTDGDGKYSFSFPSLANGKYTIQVNGDSGVTESGRPFNYIEQDIRFTFEGNNQLVTTTLVAPESNLIWQAATSSSIAITGAINNAAVAGDSTTIYNINLTNSAGQVVATTTTGIGAFSLGGSDLVAGVYSIQVVGTHSGNTITFPASVAFSFTPHSTGGTKTQSVGTISLAPTPSNITGRVKSGELNYVPGSVINFRPDKTQPPINLLYLLNDDHIRDLAKLWIGESNPAVAINCAGTGNFTPVCIMTHQGSGPWNYSTYGNKVYEVRPDGEVYFTAVAGKWAHYISAPGYSNYCGVGESDCASNPMVLTLNGQNHNAGEFTLLPSTSRSQISGTISLVDRLIANNSTNGSLAAPTTHSNISGLFVILLGNTDSSGNPVAHITTTVAGSYSFNGSSKVVALPSGLTTDQQRAGIAIQAFVGGTATSLSSATNVAGDVTMPVHITGGDYNFRQSSYQILVVDPLSHTSASSLSADTSSVASTNYVNSPVNFTQANAIAHLPRRQIAGNVFNAISTAAVAATVKIGRYESGNFVQDIRRDCTASDAANGYTCGIPSVRLPGQDQVLSSGITANGNGNFAINNLNPGNYVLRVSGNGFEDIDIPVTIPSTGNVPPISIPLVPNSGFGNLAGSILIPGGHKFTGTYNLEVVHPTSGNRPTGNVQPSSLSSGFTTFSNTSNYTLFNINAGQWKVRFVSAGYKTVEGIVNIQDGVTTQFDIITMIPGSDPPASISGRAINAINNTSSGMSGLSVRIRPGVNVTSGSYATASDGSTILPAATTASDGSFAINNVPAGNYTLEVSGSSVATAYRTVISAGTATPARQDILVSPILNTDEVRIVLSWNATPRDLDSHFEFGTSKPSQVVWNDRSKLGGDAVLDVDVVTGYGPETVTLKGSVWSSPLPRRGYSVYNWSRECTSRNGYGSCTKYAEINESGAVIRVYRSTGLVRSYAVGSGQVGQWWQIFCMGSDKSITDVGQTGCSASSFFNAKMN